MARFMNEVISIINEYLTNPTNPSAFSLKLEDSLFDLYDKMIMENQDLADELNENFPDICAEYEQGYDENKYYQLVKKEALRVENVLGIKIFQYEVY